MLQEPVCPVLHQAFQKQRMGLSAEPTAVHNNNAIGVTEWKLVIKEAARAGHWDAVRKHLAAHAAALPKSTTASVVQHHHHHHHHHPKRRNSLWERLAASTMQKPNADDRHGLLVRDSDGRTPLHVSLLSHNTPKDVILSLLRLEPRAAAVKDVAGRVPLFYSVLTTPSSSNNTIPHDLDVVAELIEAYPPGLSSRDAKHLSPLSYAMEKVTRDSNVAQQQQQQQQVPPTLWMPVPSDSPAAAWQERQEEAWKYVHLLMLSFATHPQKFMDMGAIKPMLVDALVGNAPPAVISLMVGASACYLSPNAKAVAFSRSTLLACVQRHYPDTILFGLTPQCTRRRPKGRGEVFGGLVAALLLSAYHAQTSTSDGSTTPSEFSIQFHKSIESKALSEDPAFKDWWSKLKFLIACSTGKNPASYPEEHLPHAAVSNQYIPPAIVKLLLSVNPKCLRIDCPKGAFEGALPVHMAAALPSYDTSVEEMPALTKERNLDIILDMDPGCACMRFKQQLPIHIAIQSGKRAAELMKLVEVYPDSLSQHDPITKLYPFLQLAFVSHGAKSHFLSGARTKKQKTRDAIDDLERLDTIFTFVKLTSNKGRFANHFTAIGQTPKTTAIASHFYSWCYVFDAYSKTWSPNKERLDEFLCACQTLADGGSKALLSSDMIRWLNKLMFWIKYNSTGMAAGEAEKFMLHTVLSDPTIPPLVVRLLDALDSSATKAEYGESSKLPLFIACKTPSYHPRYFERESETSLEIVLKSHPEAAKSTVGNRLPLHAATESGKSWKELELLIQAYKPALKERDPESGLLPFQLMASQHRITQAERLLFQQIAMNKFSQTQWNRMSAVEHRNVVNATRKDYELDMLTSTFGLLRNDPAVFQK